ncbi:MAG: hypothetical protein F6K54_17085 [Okeania sp. SIO3B5]|uniref:glycosyltransferase family 25 protein n=1 Tax=Okeania sp. SIO3B5 TaxID=2607811 RepID=UPI00140070AC|nr:glycosyltransferase family 25 protein [Okeania sp. SIO3B5]NEO54643.1 hypothetical protein [Okeania sp. SIO3B5]
MVKELNNSAFCINLKHREDRWKLFSEEMNKFPDNFNIVRFEAIYDPIEPRMGCAKSHIRLIEIAKNKCMSAILILEDDVVFIEKPYAKIQAVLSNLPNNWDILQLGVYETPIGEKIKENIYQIYYAQCTHCILYNHSVYDKIIAYDGKPLGIDDYISYLAATGKINLYHLHPPIAFQRKGFSNIKNVEFDWNNNNHHLNKDYKYYRAVFESIKEKNLEKISRNIEEIRDNYLREQSRIMLHKLSYNNP